MPRTARYILKQQAIWLTGEMTKIFGLPKIHIFYFILVKLNKSEENYIDLYILTYLPGKLNINSQQQ